LRVASHLAQIHEKYAGRKRYGNTESKAIRHDGGHCEKLSNVTGKLHGTRSARGIKIATGGMTCDTA
jgi:hypothetical protein